jgi:hypothetical protein
LLMHPASPSSRRIGAQACWRCGGRLNERRGLICHAIALVTHSGIDVQSFVHKVDTQRGVPRSHMHYTILRRERMVEYTSATQHSPLPTAHLTPHLRMANSLAHFGNNDIVINHADVNIAWKSIVAMTGGAS